MQSFDQILIQLKNLNSEYDKLCTLLTYEEVLVDKKLFLNLNSKRENIYLVVKKYREYLTLLQYIQEVNDFLSSTNIEDCENFNDDLKEAKEKLEKIKTEIVVIFNELDSKIEKIIIEIIAGKDVLSQKLMRCIIEGYVAFCGQIGLNYKISNDENKTVCQMFVEGLNALGYFKNESGVHEIIENKNTCKVNLIVYEDNFKAYLFDVKDVQIVATRSSGAGGQHINTTDSAIRATHMPTGISAICQDERSQIQNREKAIVRLKEKVAEYYSKESQKYRNVERKKQLSNTKKGGVTKTFDFDKGVIINNSKQSFSISDFLKGKSL